MKNLKAAKENQDAHCIIDQITPELNFFIDCANDLQQPELLALACQLKNALQQMHNDEMPQIASLVDSLLDELSHALTDNHLLHHLSAQHRDGLPEKLGQFSHKIQRLETR